MKQVYLILAALMLLCLAPMPYGYYMLVRFVAMVTLGLLLPQWFTLPSTREAHRSRINDRVLREQSLNVLYEGVCGVDGVEPVGNVAEMRVEFIGGYLPVGYPFVGKSVRKIWLDNNVGIPKSSMMGTDVANDSDASQPIAHVLKLGNHKAATHRFFGGTVVHIAIELGKRSHRCYLHRFPYRRHRRVIVLPEMFQNIFIFRTVEFVSQAVEVLRKHCAAISQRGIHEPECSVTLGKQAYHSSADNDLYLLDCREHKETQFLVKVIERDYMSESRASLESVQTFVNFHQSPIARQPEITNCIQNVSRLFDILYQETALLQNINLLLERKQLLSIFHNVQTKKWPALVRYIPCGREAAAGSIGCKVTTFY